MHESIVPLQTSEVIFTALCVCKSGEFEISILLSNIQTTQQFFLSYFGQKFNGQLMKFRELTFCDLWYFLYWNAFQKNVTLCCNDTIHRDYPFKCTIATTRAYRINCTQTGYLLQENFLVGFLDGHFSTRQRMKFCWNVNRPRSFKTPSFVDPIVKTLPAMISFLKSSRNSGVIVLDNFLVHRTWKIHAGSSILILNTLLFHFNESVNKKCQEVAICDLHVSGECDERGVILALHEQWRRNG